MCRPADDDSLEFDDQYDDYDVRQDEEDCGEGYYVQHCSKGLPF